jgi:hypothetical protein
MAALYLLHLTEPVAGPAGHSLGECGGALAAPLRAHRRGAGSGLLAHARAREAWAARLETPEQLVVFVAQVTRGAWDNRLDAEAAPSSEERGAWSVRRLHEGLSDYALRSSGARRSRCGRRPQTVGPTFWRRVA